MMRRLALVLVAGSSLATAGHLLAQQTGPHGGLLGGAGAHQAELIVSPSELTVYLIEDGKVHASKGASFRAVVQRGGKTKTINLVDQQGKRLVGRLDAPLEKGAIVVLTGKDSHGDQFSARYVIK